MTKASHSLEVQLQQKLHLNSNCECSACVSRPQIIYSTINIDEDLQLLKKKGIKSKTSDYMHFLSQVHKSSGTTLFNMQILDIVAFNFDGTVKFVMEYEAEKLKISKLSTSLKAFLSQRKHSYDLQFQKNKFQREHLEFSFTQLDHKSEKHIKQFQNNIKYMNPVLNRVAILKFRGKDEEQILSLSEIVQMFSKIARKIFDLSKVEYIQIFPIMCGFEELSFVKKVKYFRDREEKKKNFRVAQHYVCNWYSKNQLLESEQKVFLEKIINNQEEILMYFTCKLFLYFQKVSNNMVQSAIVSYITNDQGVTFWLKNIEHLNVKNLHEVKEKVKQLPQKLQDYDPKYEVKLKQSMKGYFDNFQKNYQRLRNEEMHLEEKRIKDINYSNRVFQSLGYVLPETHKNQSFIKWISDQQIPKQEKDVIELLPTERSKSQQTVYF